MADDAPSLGDRFARGVVWLSLLIFFVALASGAYFAWRLTRDHAEEFADPVAQFKYGSTGGDRNFGLPYVMWEAMPVLFRDLLPEGREDEGWAAFGLLYEDPRRPAPRDAPLPPGRHLAPHPDGHRAHLPELRRLPRRQRPRRRRRRGPDRRRHALEHRRPLGLPGLPRRRRRRRALQPGPVPRDDRRDGPRARPRQPAGAQVRRRRHGPRAAPDHRRPLRRLRRTPSRPSAPAASTPSTRRRRC